MGALLAAALSALAVSAQGGPTHLRIEWTSTAGARVVRELSCDPPGGSYAAAADACPQLAREDVVPRPGSALTAGVPEVLGACYGPLARWRVRVSGTWRGRAVAAGFTCSRSPAQLLRWARLSAFGRLEIKRTGKLSDPVWSPDGKRIAFADWSGIWIVDARGGPAYRLLPPLDQFDQLAWAPSARIVVVANFTILSVRPDGRELRVLAQGRNVAPAPDGRKVAFQEGAECGRCRGAVATVGVAGGRPVRVPWGRWLADRDPTWGPGGRLAFDRGSIEDAPDPVPTGVYVGRPGGGAAHLVRRGAILPSWSPDGARIAVADRTGVAESTWFLIRPDGSDARRLANGRSATQPLWSPSGRELLITRAVGDRVYAFVTTPLGTGLRRVTTRPLAFGVCWSWTNSVCTIRLLAWSPLGDEIVYVVPDAGCRSRALAVAPVAGGPVRLLARTC